MNGRKLYTMPKINAPCASGTFAKSNNATVARVLISILIHIGRMNSIIVMLDLFSFEFAIIHAAG